MVFNICKCQYIIPLYRFPIILELFYSALWLDYYAVMNWHMMESEPPAMVQLQPRLLFHKPPPIWRR